VLRRGKNAIDTGEFVVNMATYELREAVNITSQSLPPEIDEAALASLEMIPCRIVKAPRVAASPAHLECTALWSCPGMLSTRCITSSLAASSACTFVTMS
jgi:flavin reductase (DIM6/NTAB) family NADH-FMN oxidoreductase RutF